VAERALLSTISLNSTIERGEWQGFAVATTITVVSIYSARSFNLSSSVEIERPTKSARILALQIVSQLRSAIDILLSLVQVILASETAAAHQIYKARKAVFVNGKEQKMILYG